MNRSLLVGLTLIPSLCAGGCLDLTAARGPAVAAAPAVDETLAVGRREPVTAASTWQMPLPIAPIAAPSSGGEPIILSYVPNTGMVRGTAQALAGLGRPLEAVPGPNRTVNACREAVRSEAVKVGAREVEAVSAGTEQPDRKGRYVAPVRVRIIYDRANGLEVRESIMSCVVDAKQRIVDVYS